MDRIRNERIGTANVGEISKKAGGSGMDGHVLRRMRG